MRILRTFLLVLRAFFTQTCTGGRLLSCGFPSETSNRLRMNIAASYNWNSTNKNAQIADICSCGTGNDEVVEFFEECVGIAACEKVGGVETQVAGAFDR